MKTSVSRRDFLRTSTAATAAAMSGLSAGAVNAPKVEAPVRPAKTGELTDTNVTLSRWPFRRTPLDETPALVAKLQSGGVTQAWAGTFDGIFHKDISAANARLAEECRKHGQGLLRPFGSINPMLRDWEEDLRRCHDIFQMPGIRLHPNYHSYTLSHPAFARLLGAARERGMVVQIALAMEDERAQPALMPVPHVDASPLVAMLKETPARVMLLNWWRALKGDQLKKLAAHVYFDISTVENVGGLEMILKQLPQARLLFGSQAPLFYFESALLKLRESELPVDAAQAIRSGNARRLLGKRQ